MATALPSAVIWYGAQPVSEAAYDFTKRNDLPRLLSCPTMYDRLMLDVGRTKPGNYILEFFREYESQGRWATLFSLRDAIDRCNAVGKRPILYLGGWHATNLPQWAEHAMRGQLELVLGQILRWFEGIDGYVCDFAFDGTGQNGVTWDHVITRCLAFVKGRNAKVYVEGCAFAPSVLAGCPSMTTAASASAVPPTVGTDHAILMTNSQGTNNVPRWREEGRPIYLPSTDIGSNGSLPVWWAPAPSPIGEAA